MTETLKKLNVSDYGVALYILAAVMFMIVPIPSWLLPTLSGRPRPIRFPWNQRTLPG